MVSKPREGETGGATYEDLCAVPDHFVAEIVAGELVVSPRPAPKHALAASQLGGDLTMGFSRGGGPGGWWILFEPELHFGRDVVVPDFAGWRRDRMPKLPDSAFFELAPDWACEVISPSSIRHDRIRKMDIYGREGVRHVWLVDPLAYLLEVFRLDDGQWVRVGAYEKNTTIRAEPFDAVELDMSPWWVIEEDED